MKSNDELGDWVKSAIVREKLGLGGAILGKTLTAHPDTPWLRKNSSGRIEVLPSHPLFLEWQKTAVKRSESQKASQVLTDRVVKELNHVEEERDPEIVDLEKKSLIAKLNLPISDLEDRNLIIEQKRLKLKREAGSVISIKTADFLYFGYLKKISMEIIRSPRKFKSELRDLLKSELLRTIIIDDLPDSQKDLFRELINLLPIDEIVTQFINIVTLDQEESLKYIKKAQQNDLIEFMSEFEDSGN